MKIDKRTKRWRNRKVTIARFVLGFIAGCILYATMRPYFVSEPLISPLSDVQPLTEEEIVEDYKEMMNPSWMYESWPQSINGVPDFAQPCPTKKTTFKIVKEVEAKEAPSNPLDYIRFKGQQEGYDDYTISYFIRIARAESTLNPYAQNPNSTAKGIYQFIDGTWAQYCEGDVFDFIDNINCFYKVLEVDGYPRGLRHWSETLGA